MRDLLVENHQLKGEPPHIPGQQALVMQGPPKQGSSAGALQSAFLEKKQHRVALGRDKGLSVFISGYR
jgi:hypothetical protein